MVCARPHGWQEPPASASRFGSSSGGTLCAFSVPRGGVVKAAEFWKRVQIGGRDECWPWMGFITQNGYGRSSADGSQFYAHRRSHELIKGPIPLGYTIDHLCRNKQCVNPWHLEAVTQRENCLRAGLERRTPRQAVLNALCDWYEENGRSPRSDEWAGQHPARRTVYRLFGSWDAAVASAGLPKPSRSRFATHCKRGHPMSGDNLQISGGRRRCRECRSIHREQNRRAA